MIDDSIIMEHDLSNVAAIVGVHYGGQMFDAQKISDICENEGIELIEDAAQAFGCSLRGKSAGTNGTFGTFSFHETKNIHCGLGGALVCSSAEDFSIATYISERGSNRSDLLKGLVDKYTWVSIGGSYTLSEINAAFLNSQLRNFKDHLIERKKIWMSYYSQLKDCIDITIQRPDPEIQSNYHAFFVIFRDASTCSLIQKTLKINEVESYIGYVPLHTSPYALKNNRCVSAELPNTNRISESILRLPMHNYLTNSEVEKTCNLILKNL